MMELSRRRFGIIAATTPLWVTPMVYSVSSASAATLNSRPPTTHNYEPPGVLNAQPEMGPPLPTGIELAYTGTEQKREVEIALSAVGAGVAVWAATREPRRTTE